MARSVTALFEHRTQVDSVVGALRDAGFETDQISIVSPDEQAEAPAATPARRGVGAWVVDHLTHRGVSHEHAQRYHDLVKDGRQLVSVVIGSDVQDDDARNLMVTAGAEEISSASDGKMVPVWRSGDQT